MSHKARKDCGEVGGARPAVGSDVEELSRRGAAGLASQTKGRSRVFRDKTVYDRKRKRGGEDAEIDLGG